MARTLDPDVLDAIVADLEIADLAALDRMLFAMRLFLDDVEAWLRRLANDEDSWLNRLADLFGAGADFADGANVLDLILLGIPFALIAATLSAGAIVIWRRCRRAPRPASALPPFSAPVTAAIAPAGDDMPAREQPAALFRRACGELAHSGILQLDVNLTNSAIAHRARLSGGPRLALQRLANAADRALFGGWLPSDEDLRELHTEYRELRNELGRPT